jgi:hypothetical protein
MMSGLPRGIRLLALAALLAAPAHGEPAEDPGWEFSIAPYLWFFNLTGDVGAAGRESSVETSLIDLFQNNDSVLGLQANLQARNGPWTLLADTTWLRVEDDFDLGGDLVSGNADVTGDVVLVDLMVMREVWRRSLGEPVVEKGMSQRAAALDLLGGVRVWVIDTELELEGTTPGPIIDELDRSFNDTQSWADPVIGARATLDLTDRLHLAARGDIGGFHIASDLTSELWANLVLDFGLLGHDAFAALGYRALYTDYDSDGGFLLQTWLHGPTLGVGVRF